MTAHNISTHAENNFKANLGDVIYAFSDALDLVGVSDVGHGKRVGTMAASCGRVLGYSETENAFLFELGMLHDIGVSSTAVHMHLVSEFDWEASNEHCQIGYRLLNNFPPLRTMALPVLYHHTHWEDLCLRRNVPHEVALRANLIFLVDRVDACAAPFYADRSLLMKLDFITDQILQHAGTHFAPELVDAFMKASRNEAFWLQLEQRSLQKLAHKMHTNLAKTDAGFSELKQLGEIFSSIVDAKSPFTAQHSLGVARLSRLMAEEMGITEENCEKLEIAGLLHDLGKLRIPDAILDKAGSLNLEERKIINTHSFETFEILNGIHGFEDIAAWASQHHEEPDGGGYPFGMRSNEMSLEARILRVADIFQAMVQDRPYRKGLKAEEALLHLQMLGTQGRVEKDVVNVLGRQLDASMQAAKPKLPMHMIRGTQSVAEV